MPSRKTALITRSVVELDLIGYSHIVKELEGQTDASVVIMVNDQVQRFVDDGLREVNRERKDVVNGTAGDNALVVFERTSEAHRFAEAVHRAAERYNRSKVNPKTQRHFRIGIATGQIAAQGKQLAGAHIIDSVRFEAAGCAGHVLIDQATYDDLPAQYRRFYRGPETVKDKHGNRYAVYRYEVSEPRSGRSTKTKPKRKVPATGKKLGRQPYGFKQRLLAMEWSQFCDLVDRLGIDQALFSQNEPPADRSFRFERQMIVKGLTAHKVEDALRSC